MPFVYLILGGNKGNRTKNISEAIDLVTSNIGPKKAISGLYESESWGFKSEPFINQVIRVETSLSPEEILLCTQQIENKLGRTRKTEGYEARTIDIDILYYDLTVLDTPNLIIPHPKIAVRRFVLVPLAEIAPDFRDPVTGITALEMLENCQDNSDVRLKEKGERRKEKGKREKGKGENASACIFKYPATRIL
jgi:2-amino-4-hydroxy-6-hydroxymethyldihydropteridine diphosphokinase